MVELVKRLFYCIDQMVMCSNIIMIDLMCFWKRLLALIFLTGALLQAVNNSSSSALPNGSKNAATKAVPDIH